MTKKSKTSSSDIKRAKFIANDVSQWNFIIFLTLAFLLIIAVVSTLKTPIEDLRTRAGLACPKISLPDPKGCSGEWIYTTADNGCPTFVCR